MYYRVNYDEPTWLSIASALQTDLSSIHAASRAQLLSDAAALAREGTLSYNASLAQTEYLVIGKADNSIFFMSNICIL